MADNKHPDEQSFERVAPGDVVEKVPDAQRDEVKQIQKSLEKPWEPQRERYQVAGWLAKGLLYAFVGVITWSGVLVFTLLFRSMSAPIDKAQADLVTGFFKDLLPFIATPLGVALGFYFRESHSDPD